MNLYLWTQKAYVWVEREGYRLAVSRTWSQSWRANCSLIFSIRAGTKLWKFTIVLLIISRQPEKFRLSSISLALPKYKSGSGVSPLCHIVWDHERFEVISPKWKQCRPFEGDSMIRVKNLVFILLSI